MKKSVVVVIVLDALGVETLHHYFSHQKVSLPNLSRYGLGNILQKKFAGITKEDAELCFTASPSSVWADSVMGHRELVGYIDKNDFSLFKEGMPPEFVTVLEQKTGKKVLFNQRCGGGDAIMKNHDAHAQTGGLILYTSMCDPIPQIAAWEEIIPPQELASYVQTAYELATHQGINITRAISRPYIVKDGEFVRTSNRKDVVAPFPKNVTTLIHLYREKGIKTVSIGKSADVINTTWDEHRELGGELPPSLQQMFTHPKKADKNPYCVKELLRVLEENKDDDVFVLCNLPDTDTLYGHTRQVKECVLSLQAIDTIIPLIENAMPENSYLFFVADHGMRDGGDYGYHNREAIPVLGKSFSGKDLGTLSLPKKNSYAVVGYLCAQLFNFGDEYIEKCKLENLT